MKNIRGEARILRIYLVWMASVIAASTPGIIRITVLLASTAKRKRLLYRKHVRLGRGKRTDVSGSQHRLQI
jgi:hypothetical protein